MSYKLTITVTKDILKKAMYCGQGGEDEIPHNCAIALAVRDIFPNASVSGSQITVFHSHNKYGWTGIPISVETGQYIRRFDNTPYLFRPGLPEYSFDIDVPDEVIKMINIDEIQYLLTNHPTLKLQAV